MADPLYIVLRDCHRGPGSCDTCYGYPTGRVVEQTRTTDKQLADAFVLNWRSYNATIHTRQEG